MAMMLYPTKITVSVAARATPGCVRGWTFGESAGSPAAAKVRLWDNASAASGTLVGVIDLAASSSSTFTFPGDGVYLAKGLYVEIVSGSVEGSVLF